MEKYVLFKMNRNYEGLKSSIPQKIRHFSFIVPVGLPGQEMSESIFWF